MKQERAHQASVRDCTADELLAAARFGIPGIRSSHVRRPRLVAALTEAPELPLVLVSGPAGTGKTALVAEWVRETQEIGTTGWVTFEDGDDDFWGHLLECLRRLGLDTSALGEDPPADTVLGIRRLQALAAALAEQPGRLTVVVDGYELVSLDLAREVDFLLRHTFGHLRLVFVGRVDPVLPLYRYRLSDSLAEVRAADLAFTDEEAAALLDVLGVPLSKDSLRDLNARVKGWVAGLRFAARALAGRSDPDASVALVVSQAGDINEYLVGEVLDAQSPETRKFMLDTSVPDVLLPGLVEELAGSRGPRMLEELARVHAFIETVPDQPTAYRYYPFFRDLLRAQLAYESAERLELLHRRVAEWFRREGLTDLAIHHLAEVAAWEDLAALVVDDLMVGRLLLEGSSGFLAETGRRLPAAVDSALACVVRAATALVDGDRETCRDELVRARRADTAGPAADVPLRLSILVLDAVRAALADPAETAAAAADEARRALGGGSAHERSAPESELYALVQLSTGIAMLRRGDLRRARKALTIAVGLDASRRFPSFRADCLGYLALLDAHEGYLSRASRTAAESSATASAAGIPLTSCSPAAQVALARVALEQYELKEARELVTSAAASRGLQGDPLCRGLLQAVIAGLERAGGHLQPALTRLSTAAAAAAGTDPWLAGCLRVEAARLSVASGRAELALRDLEAVAEQVEPQVAAVAAAACAEQGEDAAAGDFLAETRKGQPRLPTQVTGLLAEVVQESRRRQAGRARVLLDQSLRLAEPEGLRRPFREAGPAVQRLLAADGRLLQEHPWLNHSGPPSGEPRLSSYRGAAAGGPERDPQVVESLTAKELEVLGHLEELLTTEEIAEKMFVSVNTVRTHVRSILRKLGVSRRNAAVRKARELGLFAG